METPVTMQKEVQTPQTDPLPGYGVNFLLFLMLFGWFFTAGIKLKNPILSERLGQDFPPFLVVIPVPWWALTVRTNQHDAVKLPPIYLLGVKATASFGQLVSRTLAGGGSSLFPFAFTEGTECDSDVQSRERSLSFTYNTRKYCSFYYFFFPPKGICWRKQ